MGKATEYRNCSLCTKRRQCWKTERYGDRGERGKRPFPTEAVCDSFRSEDADKENPT